MRIKSIYTLFIALCVLLLNTSCEANIEDGTSNQGSFSLSLGAGDVQSEVITRASLSGDVATFQVNLADAEGNALIEKKAFGALTETECTLPAEKNYQLLVENCTPDEAITLNEGWGMAHFKGTTTFDIESNKQTEVSLTCTMDNVGLQVVFDQSFLDKFPIHAATTQDSRVLKFTQETQDKIAFYNVEGDELTIQLQLTGSSGGWNDRLNTTKELILSKGKVYTVNVFYSESKAQGAEMRVTALR